MVLKVKLLDSLFNYATDQIRLDTLDQRIEFQRLLHSQNREDGVVLRAVSNELASVCELSLHVEALNVDLTCCWDDLSRQTLECGRLASTVNTEQSEALTVIQAETCLPHCNDGLLEGWLVNHLEIVHADTVHLRWVFRPDV